MKKRSTIRFLILIPLAGIVFFLWHQGQTRTQAKEQTIIETPQERIGKEPRQDEYSSEDAQSLLESKKKKNETPPYQRPPR